MSYSFDSVRAKVRAKSRETDLKADVLYQRYLLERLIAHIAASKHRGSIIIKGGMLVSAISGVDMRTTKDLDATVRGKDLTMRDYRNIIDDVLKVELNDNVKFSFVRMEEIVLDNRYPCCRLHLRALFGTMDSKVEIDFTCGDAITPKEVEFGFPTLFGNERIPVLVYTLETLLAEKMTAILDLGVFNSRAKDFYDVYLLTTLLADKIDKSILPDAFGNTLRQRGKAHLLENGRDIILQTVNSPEVQAQWRRYCAEYPYATDIEFGQIVSAIAKLFGWAGIETDMTHMKRKPGKESLLDRLAEAKVVVDAQNAASISIPTKKARSHNWEI